MKSAILSRIAVAWQYFIYGILCGIGFQNQAAAQNSGNAPWHHLKYAIYFTSYDVDCLLADPVQFKKTMDYFAPVRPVHVYLEGSGHGEINVRLLTTIADKFRGMGIKVSGAMVPIGDRGPSTYNNPDDLGAIEKRMRSLAQVFDDVILDDWLFTSAADTKSVVERGFQSWADYRTKLILEQSQKYILDPAKAVNPKIKVTIKYPNWYESHRDNGYDVYHETSLFDHMAVGIETRNRMVHDQHIPIYSGYIFQKWWSSVDPQKWVGSWLDNYEMKGDSKDYIAQVWQAVLAQTPEIILWCAGGLYPTNPASDVYPDFVKMLPEFDRIAGLLQGEARGIPIYLPYGSAGEYNIFGYLGMNAIPLIPVAEFPAESKNAIFTLHSMSDGSLGRDTLLAEKMLGRLRSGKDVFMTWELWKKLRNTEFKNTLNLLPNSEGTVTSDQIRIREGWYRQVLVKSEKSFTFPKIATTTWPSVRDIAVERDDYDYGVLFHVQYLKGNIYILNMPDNSYDFLRFPAQALNLIRQAFREDVGADITGPGGVGVYLYGKNQFVLYNMSDETAEMKLRSNQKFPITGWKELVHGKAYLGHLDSAYVRYGEPVITEVPVTIKPFEILILQEP